MQNNFADIIENLWAKSKAFYDPQIEKIRQELCNDDTVVIFKDYGSGSRFETKKKFVKKKKVSQICKKTTIPARQGAFLYLLVKHFKPENCLELGTGLGFSSAYILKALNELGQGMLFSVEGADTLYEIALKNIKRLNLKNYLFFNDTFESALPQLTENQKFDFVFFDGNHSFDATLNYVNFLKPYLNTGALLVFDDIFWSVGMFRAWQKIKKEFKNCVRIRDTGICFFY